MADYKAAAISFDNFINDFPATKLKSKAYNYILKSKLELAIYSKYDLKKERLESAIDFSPLCMTDEQIAEVKRIRKKTKGGALTQRVVNSLAVEFEAAAKIGWGPDDILSEWELRGCRVS